MRIKLKSVYGYATVSDNPSDELIEAVNKMAELAFYKLKKQTMPTQNQQMEFLDPKRHDNLLAQFKQKNKWIKCSDRLPTEEGYYRIRYENGTEDQKPFRIRPSKNIKGFMTEETVVEWQEK